MPVAFVKQYTGGSSTAQTTGTAITITAPSAGNALVACIALGSSTANASVSSIATTGGTWVRVAQSAFNATGTNRQEIWVCTGTTISGTSFTPTFSATCKWTANVQEWSGLSATVDVTAVSSTGSVTNATNTTTSTDLSTPGGDLIIGAMNLATSNSSANFSSTSGSPDARTALTWSGSGATTSNNVGMQPVYDISSATFINETFSWVTTASWQYAWAAVSLRAKTRTAAFASSMTGTPVIAKIPAKALTASLTPMPFLNRSGWTATASDLNGSFDPPANALDGDLTTRYSSGHTQYVGMWYQVDMQTAQTFDLVVLSVPNSPGDYAFDVQVDVSNNGTTWTTAGTTVGLDTDVYTAIPIPQQTARYLKLTVIAASGNWWSIDELLLYQTIPLARQISRHLTASTIDPQLDRSAWTVSASDYNVGFDQPSKAIDGNLATRYSTSTAQLSGMWFQIDMGSARLCTSLVLNNVNDAGDYPFAYSLATSSDGVTFGSAIASGGGASSSTTISFAATSARYWRITLTASVDGGGGVLPYWSIDEVYAYQPIVAFARTRLKALTATMMATVVLARQPSKVLAATITMTVSWTRLITRTVNAVLTASSAVSPAWLKAFTASLTATPSLGRAPLKVLAATVTAVPNIGKTPLKTFVASMAATAGVAKTPLRALTASVLVTVTTAKTVLKAITATLLAAPSTAKIPLKALTAGVTPVPNLGRTVLRILTASMAAAPSIARMPIKQIFANVTSTATLRRFISRTLSGSTVTMVGVLAKSPSKVVSASVIATTGFVKTVQRSFGTVLVPSAAISRRVSKILKATVDLGATLSSAFSGAGHVYNMALTASLDFSAYVSKTVSRPFNGTIIPGALLQRTIAKRLGAVLETSAQLSRFINRSLAAALPVSAHTSRQVSRVFAATVVSTSEVHKTVLKRLAATVSATVLLGRQTSRTLGAAIEATASLQRLTMRNFAAILPLRGSRYVALFRPLLRFARVFARRSRLFVPEERVHIATAPSRARILTVVPRAHNFKKVEDIMKLVPSGSPGKEAEIGPTEANIEFTADFEDDMPANTAIVGYQVDAFRLGTGENITDSFVALVSQATTKVTAIVGDGEQALKAVYRLRYTITLNNSPASTIVGVLDVECKD